MRYNTPTLFARCHNSFYKFGVLVQYISLETEEKSPRRSASEADAGYKTLDTERQGLCSMYIVLHALRRESLTRGDPLMPMAAFHAFQNFAHFLCAAGMETSNASVTIVL